MKKIIVMGMLLNSAFLFGQTKADTIAIKETTLNYIEGFYTNDWQRMEKAIHPELAKRVINKDDQGNEMLKNTGSSELIFSTRHFKKKDDNPNEPFKADVQIFDISHDIAVLKVSTNKLKFFDYLQLAKIGGAWKIINALWARTE